MNGYFTLFTTSKGTGIKVFAPTDGGSPVSFNIIKEYLDDHKIEFDIVNVNKAVTKADGTEMIISSSQVHPERETYKLYVSGDKMLVTAFFYAPFDGSELVSKDELLKDISLRKITTGIKTDNINSFFEKREYCTDIVIAEGIVPVEGKDAEIEYLFNRTLHARPELREDGSVDYHNLNLINHCKKGDILAKLTQADNGKTGQNVMGESISPKPVKQLSLSKGKNIDLSEDKLSISAGTNGHVCFQNGKIVVSDVMTLKNVDVSTGNIEYDGSVEVEESVASGFSIKAGGNIHISGNVEGAVLEAGSDIILERGVNGMGSGRINCGGNLVSKFIENAEVRVVGSISAESIIRSDVSSETVITVDGRRGFITGGHVSAAESISVKTLGSDMGVNTLIEVGVNPGVKQRIKQLNKELAEAKKTLDKIMPTIDGAKLKLKKGIKLTPEQANYVKQLILVDKKLTDDNEKRIEEITELQNKILDAHTSFVKVSADCYPGTTVVIGEMSMIVKKTVSHGRFILDGADVRVSAY